MSGVIADLIRLKRELQNRQNSSQFEQLAAALLGRLVDVPIPTAKSGFQYGADAGPAGQQGRRFRVECKQYRDTTRLVERELLGEIEQALARDRALEAWVLVTTRRVPEQIWQSLNQHGEQRGVPIVIIDWSDHENPPLAALCASDPDLVEKAWSSEAGAAACALQSVSADAINRLKRQLASWSLGFESLRHRSHDKLNKIWNSPRESNSALGQDIAGGSRHKKIKRKTVHIALNDWWRGRAQCDAPAAIIGREGTGKTWATLNWLIDNKAEQPVVLMVPSSAVSPTLDFSESNVKQFIADRLYETSGVRDSGHWLRRLNNLLKRPVEEGPVLTIVFDGLNQESSVSWLDLFKVLQGEVFAGRVRPIITTRKHHFENKLSKLNGLIVPAVPIEVNRYDTVPGGELDRMLEYEGLVRDDLHADVLEMARTPRLFELVVRFREKLANSGQVTIHRLLWEYGRDTLGVRAGRSFSEEEWREWLKRIARQHRDGIHNFSTKSLGQTVKRPDLTEREVYARLSDIIDGKFAIRNQSGDFQLTSEVIAHALGAALLTNLHQVKSPTFESVDDRLKQWLEPISGFDQPAEILRAAVSILIEQGRSESPPVSGVLLTAWLQSQNVADAYRQEIVDLAPRLVEALLDVVEHSESRTHDSARSWAVKALRAVPRTNGASLTSIIARGERWLRSIFRDIDARPSAEKERNKWRSDQLIRRIGTDSAGPISVTGIELTLVDQPVGMMKATVPAIIEGFPLAVAMPIFEAAATELAVTSRSECWDELRWICLLNEVDPKETAMKLRELSTRISRRNPEPSIHPDLPKRIAALLLWLTGQEVDDEVAASLNPGIGRMFSYEQDYLPRPSHSLLRLERRHAEITLNDTKLRLEFRIKRIGELWLDPSFVPPESFVAELRSTATSIDMEKLYRHRGRTIEDHHFEELEPALARCAPDLLGDLIRRKMQGFATCPQESRYRNAYHATDHMVLAGEAEMVALQTMRLSDTDGDDKSEGYAASHLLLMELRDLDVQNQFDTLIRAKHKVILCDFSRVLRPPTPADINSLINRYSTSSRVRQRDLLTLLSSQRVKLSDEAWSWVEEYRRPHEHQELRGLVFKILARTDLVRFGRNLLDDGWSWNPAYKMWINHYGTDALIEAGASVAFDELAPKLAPWRLLEAVRRRGANPKEIWLAAGILDCTFTDDEVKVTDPGSNLSIDVTRVKSWPFLYSVEPRPSDNEVENFRLAFDTEARARAYQRAIDTAASRIQEARRSGAILYNISFFPEDFDPILRHASEFVDRWLEGCSKPTAEFQRRVLLAEGFFMALCEALLVHIPEQGSQLWRVLRASMMTRYIGEAGVDDLVHMVFRVPASPAVENLRDELSELKYCHTDQALFDLAIAASHSGKIEWLNKVIKDDRASPYAWRRRRATILEGFSTNNSVPITGAWPDRELKTDNAHLILTAARLKFTEACARHWWRTYLKARDPATAYAAWVLFLRSADRRNWVWMKEDTDNLRESNNFFDLKIAHFQLNQRNLKRAMKEREKKFDQNFLHRKVSRDIGPWI